MMGKDISIFQGLFYIKEKLGKTYLEKKKTFN